MAGRGRGGTREQGEKCVDEKQKKGEAQKFIKEQTADKTLFVSPACVGFETVSSQQTTDVLS